MEAYGNSFLIIIILLALLISLKFRYVGLSVAGLALFLLLGMPLISFQLFKYHVYGIYVNKKQQILTIYHNGTYSFYDHGKMIDSADIQFVNGEDAYNIDFSGFSSLELKSNEQFGYNDDPDSQFVKVK